MNRRRLFTMFLAGLTALAFMAAVFLTFLLHRKLPDPQPFTIAADGQTGPISGWIAFPPDQTTRDANLAEGPGMLILFADRAAPRVSDRLLAAALADAGFGLAVILTGSHDGDPLPLARIITGISSETGVQSEHMVTAWFGNHASRLTGELVSMQPEARPAGLVLVSPASQDRTLAGHLSGLSGSLKSTIITSSSEPSADVARALFHYASGEDASFFPGLDGPGELSPEVILSLDGRERLVLVPALSVFNEGWSPRLHQAVQQAVAMDPAAMAEGPVPVQDLYHRLLLPIWILMLLASVPLLLTLTRSSAATADDRMNGGDAPFAAELMLYLPAAAAAMPIGRLLAGLAGDARLSGGYAFYAFIGAYGWLLMLLHLVWPSGRVTNRPGSRYDAVAVGRTILFAVIFLTAVIFWLTTVFGSLLPQGQTLLQLAPAAFLLMPAMLPACLGYRRTRTRQRLVLSLGHLAASSLFLAVLVWLQNPSAISGALSLMGLLLVGRIIAKSLSWDPAPQMIASAAGAWLMLLIQPIPLI